MRQPEKLEERRHDHHPLRVAAEEKLTQSSSTTPARKEKTPEALIHELQAHQVDLVMQNEKLRRARGELEALREKYYDLYDLAPVGYFTLSERGMILEANLTAARLLGVTKGALAMQPLARFILPEDQNIYYRHRKQLFATGAPGLRVADPACRRRSVLGSNRGCRSAEYGKRRCLMPRYDERHHQPQAEGGEY